MFIRKPVFLLVLFLACSVVLPAQFSFPLNCSANASVTPLIRADALAEQVGDLVLICTGGFLTSKGSPVPTVDFRLFLNTNITSALLANPLSEALLIIDDPQPAMQRACIGTCSITSTGDGRVYDGATGHPNIFQGRRETDSSIVWPAVPVEPPGSVQGTRIIRITNIRANTKKLGTGSGGWRPSPMPAEVSGYVSATGSTTIPVEDPQQTLAFVQKGSGYSAYASSGSGFNYELEFREGFASSFKVRGAVQSLPGASYNTETGFYNPALPVDNGLSSAGYATQATRLMLRFQGVPDSAQIRVSITQISGAGISARLTKADATGAGAYDPIAPTSPTPSPGVALVPISGGKGQAVYEILSASPFHNESFRIGVQVSGTTTLPPVIANFAPFSNEVVASATAPRPRYFNVPLNPDKAAVFTGTSWQVDVNGNGTWEPGLDRSYSFGWAGTPLAGDWNGDGMKEIGVFKAGAWHLDFNSNGAWDGTAKDKAYTFNLAGAVPVIGDWNGDGKTEIGLYSNCQWRLDYNGNGVWDGAVKDRRFTFGWTGGIPVVGDWNGDRKTEIGIEVDGIWYLDSNGNGVWNGFSVDKWFAFGGPAVKPLVGDWNGDGRTKVGVFKDGDWFLDYNGNGVWDGSYVDQGFTFGSPNVTPIVGDWFGGGRSFVGYFDSGYWSLYNGKSFTFGTPTSKPVIGNW